VTATHRNRIMFRDGSAIAAAEGGQIRLLSGYKGEDEADLRSHLGRALYAPRTSIRGVGHGRRESVTAVLAK
jgi:hypothetical protein